MGTLDTDPGVTPERHVYVGNKAPWFEITDDLPQYTENPESTTNGASATFEHPSYNANVE
jgi:hypothetical protein